METKDKWELTLKTAALFGGLVAGIFAYFKYSDTKEKEFYTSYWNAKVTAYKEVADVAATLATTSSPTEYQRLRERYWALSFGPLTLVESTKVSLALEAFGNVLDKEDAKELPASLLEPYANDLSGVLKDDLISSWRKPFAEFEYWDPKLKRAIRLPGPTPLMPAPAAAQEPHRP